MKLAFRLPVPSISLTYKPYIKYILAGLGIYVFFLFAKIPAQWLAWGVNKYSNGTATLTLTTGTLWKGTGQLAISYNRSKPVNIGRINWNIHTPWLVIGKLDATIGVVGKGMDINTDLALSPGTFSVSNMLVTIQGASLGTLYSPASLISPTGSFRIESDSLKLSKQGMEGSANGQWLDAGSTLSAVNPLGSYTFQLNGNGENAAIILSSGNNSSLKLEGKGNLSLINGLVNFNGSATPVNRQQELEPLLILLGRDLGAGKRLLRFSTRIPVSLPGRKS